MTTALAIRDDQDTWDDRQLAALAQMGVSDQVSQAELVTFLHECQRRRLDPFLKQIYLIGRWDRRAGREVYRAQTSIDGFRVIARRAADRSGIDYSYEDCVWFGADGGKHEIWLGAEPPAGAKVVVVRNGHRYDAAARFTSYAQTAKDGRPAGRWAEMPDTMIAKCFSPDTEVLTDRGFARFPDVGSNCILQVTAIGLEAVQAIPFVQQYTGPMVTNNGERLNFSVTPNHDMVTTAGKVEAGAMYATTRQRGPWRIPMTVPGRAAGLDMSGTNLAVAGYIAADGWHNGHRRFNVSVSRPYKVAALHNMQPESVHIRNCAGDIAEGVRQVRSNFDKTCFTFFASRVAELMNPDKTFRMTAVLALSQQQARIVLDAWQEFDGHTNRTTGVRRIYTSRTDHVAVIEVLAMAAGYTINVPRKQHSDLSREPGYMMTISAAPSQPVHKPAGSRAGLHLAANATGEVWCVTVPSGCIVVRRNGFAMVCGNCAEALALRKAFPEDLGGLYTDDEMGQAAEPAAPPANHPPDAAITRPSPVTPAGQPTTEIDPDAQAFADEAHQAATVGDLAAVGVRARDAGKQPALIRDPASGKVGGLGQYIAHRRRVIEDTSAALTTLTEAAAAAGVSPVDLDEKVRQVTGAGLEDATGAQLRETAAVLIEAVQP